MCVVTVSAAGLPGSRSGSGTLTTSLSPLSRIDALLLRYPAGSLHDGVVTRVESYGVFVGLEVNVSGLCKRERVAWGSDIEQRATSLFGGTSVE